MSSLEERVGIFEREGAYIITFKPKQRKISSQKLHRSYPRRWDQFFSVSIDSLRRSCQLQNKIKNLQDLTTFMPYLNQHISQLDDCDKQVSRLLLLNFRVYSPHSLSMILLLKPDYFASLSKARESLSLLNQKPLSLSDL